MPVYTESKFVNELDPLDNPTGNMDMVIHDPDSTDHTYRVKLSQIMPSAVSQDFTWNPAVIYNEDDVVVLDDLLWISQQDQIEPGPMPGTDEDFWLPGTRGKTGVPWEAGVFTEAYPMVFYNANIYLLTAAARPYNSTDIAAEIVTGDWLNLSGEDLFSTSTAGANIAFDCRNARAVMLEGSAAIAAPKVWDAPINATNTNRMKFNFSISGAHAQTLFANVKLFNTSNANWNTGTKQWVPLRAGEYVFEATKNLAGQWRGSISGPIL